MATDSEHRRRWMCTPRKRTDPEVGGGSTLRPGNGLFDRRAASLSLCRRHALDETPAVFDDADAAVDGRLDVGDVHPPAVGDLRRDDDADFGLARRVADNTLRGDAARGFTEASLRFFGIAAQMLDGIVQP
eukprot:TRINITY_DN9455_c0_g1_i1.p3 TRINITY_DN9455_c0_g1~~TRINITY_DN9455_c0_g1_i1.p3  ORF type:complete len:131 (+),score=4.46 TRINITY_DN9455_c0_g1_i1:184-576(+)